MLKYVQRMDNGPPEGPKYGVYHMKNIIKKTLAAMFITSALTGTAMAAGTGGGAPDGSPGNGAPNPCTNDCGGGGGGGGNGPQVIRECYFGVNYDNYQVQGNGRVLLKNVTTYLAPHSTELNPEEGVGTGVRESDGWRLISRYAGEQHVKNRLGDFIVSEAAFRDFMPEDSNNKTMLAVHLHDVTVAQCEARARQLLIDMGGTPAPQRNTGPSVPVIGK